jgi:hypothetical protein
MQVGCLGMEKMIEASVRKLLGGDPVALDRLKGAPMHERTIASVRCEQVRG